MLTCSSCGDKPDVYDVSIPNLKTAKEEIIVAFELNVSAGTVQTMSNVPFGWNVTVENDAGWHSKILAKSTLGAASLASDELKKLVFSVRRNESIGAPFDMWGTFVVMQGFGSPRKIPVTMKDLTMGGT